MSSSPYKDIIRRYVDAFNRGDIEDVCQCFTPDALVYGVLGWGDIAKIRPIWSMLVRCFAIQLDIESIIEDGNTIAVRYTESGQFINEFREIEPTGKPYKVVAMEWFEMSPEGIRRRWGARDNASQFRQMGIPLA